MSKAKDAMVAYAVRSLSKTMLLRPCDVSSWVKDFHFLYQYQKHDTLAKFAFDILPNLHFFRPTELVMIAHHYTRGGYNDYAWWIRFSSGILPLLQDMDGKDLSLLVNAFVQFRCPPVLVTERLVTECIEWAAFSNAKNASLLISGLSRMRGVPRTVFSAFARRVMKLVDSLNVVDSACIVAGFSRAQYFDPCLMNAIATRIMEFRDISLEQHLSMIAWGFSRLNCKNKKLYDYLSFQLKRISDRRELDASYFSNAVSSFAKMKFSNVNIVEVIRRQLPLCIKKLDSVGKMICFTGMARLEISKAEPLYIDLLSSITEDIQKQLLCPNHVSNIVKAASRLGFMEADYFWNAAADFLTKRFPELGMDHAVNSCLAFASLPKHQNWTNNFFSSIIPYILSTVDSLSPKSLANLMRAFSTVDETDSDLLRAIINESIKKAEAFNWQDCYWIVLSCHKLGILSSSLLSALEQPINNNVKKFSEKQLTELQSIYGEAGIRLNYG